MDKAPLFISVPRPGYFSSSCRINCLTFETKISNSLTPPVYDLLMESVNKTRTTLCVPYSAASFISPWSRAARRRGGDIGNADILTPVAFSIALATAAIGGTIGTSPTPRTP